jgi:hypothetical protein
MMLQAVSDDISFIESQNRGLQVQTSNQQALLNELRQLLVSVPLDQWLIGQQIVEVPAEDLRILLQESPGTQRGIQLLEKAATSLYKALQAGMDTGELTLQAEGAQLKERSERGGRCDDCPDERVSGKQLSVLQAHPRLSRDQLQISGE